MQLMELLEIFFPESAIYNTKKKEHHQPKSKFKGRPLLFKRGNVTLSPEPSYLTFTLFYFILLKQPESIRNFGCNKPLSNNDIKKF